MTRIALRYILFTSKLCPLDSTLPACRLTLPPPAPPCCRPAQLAKLFSMDLYRSAQSYSLDKWWYNFAKGFYTLAETLIVLCSGMLPWLWGFISRVSPGIDDLGEIPHTIIFVLILTLGSTLTSLPWSAYFIFVIEQKHGFNKQIRSVFIGDTLTTVMLTVLLLPPVVAIFTFILLNTGPWVPMYLWLFILGVSLFMMAIYPVVIAPLFNKYEVLPEGSLKVSIEALASSLSFPLKKLYSMDGSKRSGHANAYMYGFGSNKRIVVYDTLMKDCSEDQVVAVLAHGECRGGLGSSRAASGAGPAAAGAGPAAAAAAGPAAVAADVCIASTFFITMSCAGCRMACSAADPDKAHQASVQCGLLPCPCMLPCCFPVCSPRQHCSICNEVLPHPSPYLPLRRCRAGPLEAAPHAHDVCSAASDHLVTICAVHAHPQQRGAVHQLWVHSGAPRLPGLCAVPAAGGAPG